MRLFRHRTGHIKHEPFVDAYVEDATYSLTLSKYSREVGYSPGFRFHSGIWKDGVWRNGVWQNGIWESGTWMKGEIASPYYRTVTNFNRECLNRYFDLSSDETPADIFRHVYMRDEGKKFYEQTKATVERMLANDENILDSLKYDNTDNLYPNANVAHVLEELMLFDWSEEIYGKIKSTFRDMHLKYLSEGSILTKADCINMFVDEKWADVDDKRIKGEVLSWRKNGFQPSHA